MVGGRYSVGRIAAVVAVLGQFQAYKSRAAMDMGAVPVLDYDNTKRHVEGVAGGCNCGCIVVSCSGWFGTGPLQASARMK